MIREALGDMFASTQKDFKTPAVLAEEIVVTQGDAVDCILQEVGPAPAT